MITTTYNIVTRYKTDASGARREVDKLGRSTDELGDKTERAEGIFSRLGATAKAALVGAASFGVAVLTRHIVGLQSEIENAEVSIASVFSVNKITTFSKGLDRARGLMSRFRKAAITSPGESRDLLSIFTATAPALFRSGDIDDSAIEQFASRGLAAAFTLGGGDVQTTGQQLAQILMGQGGADNRIFQSLRGQLRSALNIEEVGSKFVEQFNKIANTDPSRVFEALQTSLSSLDEANVTFGKTFTGMWGSLKETVNSFLIDASRPLFDEMKRSFADVLGFASDNDKALSDLANTVGQKLAGAFRVLAGSVKFAKENIDGLVISASILGAVKGVGAIRSAAGGGLLARAGQFTGQASSTRRRIQSAASGGFRSVAGFGMDFAGEALFGGAAPKALTKGGQAFRSLRSMPGRAKSALARQVDGRGINFETLRKAPGAAKGGLAALATGGAGAAKGGIVALGGALGTLATVALPLTVIIGMVVGTFRVLKDETNEATIFLKTSFNELMTALDSLAGQFGFSGEGGFANMLASFADWLGTGVVGIMGLAVKGVERVVTAFGVLVTALKGIAYGVSNVFGAITSGDVGSLSDLSNLFSQGFKKAEDEAASAFASAAAKGGEGQGNGPSPKDERAAIAEMNRKKREEEMKKGDKSKTEINVKNEVKVETDADPDRIAFRTGEVTVDSIRRLRMSAQGLPGFE